MKNLNEREILQKLAQSDQFSFGLIFTIYYSRLYHFSFHYLNDEESSKDVVQDVFSAIWEDRTKMAEVKNLSSWLYSVTKNLCLKKIDQLKIKQKHSDILKYRQLSMIQISLNELDTSPVIFNEMTRIVERTLEKLPLQSRRIFELSRYENKKNREIAEELGISPKTVEAHITKTLADLRKALRHYLPLFIA